MILALVAALVGCTKAAPQLEQLGLASKTTTIPEPFVIFSGAPSGSSNLSSLNIGIAGANVGKYRYKIGLSASTNCSDPSGYSADLAITTPITDSMSSFSDGDHIILCAFGLNGTRVQSIASFVTWSKDVSSPTIMAADFLEADGVYRVGATLTVKLTFNENVSVTGVPQLKMSTNSLADYWTGSGTNQLMFRYTVAASDNNGDFDYKNATSLTSYMGAGTIKDAAGNNADTTLPSTGSTIADSRAVVLDNIAPTFSGTVNHSTYYNSATQSPTLSWPSASDGGSGVTSYWVSVGTSPGTTDVVAWTNVGNTDNTQLSSLSLSNGVSYFPQVKAADAAGNMSAAVSGAAWIVDTSPPTTPGSFSDGEFEYSLAQSPTFSWNASTDTGGSGLDHYELAIGTSAGGTNLVNWTSVGTGTTYTASSLSLARGQTYYASIRAVDAIGNVSNAVNGDGWAVAKPMWVTDNTVRSAEKVGSKLYIGGDFTTIGPASANGVTLSASTGRVPSNFQYWNRPDGLVQAVIPDGAGGWFIGGNFLNVGSVARTRLAHINADGSLDTSWVASANGAIYALELSGGTLYVSGNFTQVNSTGRFYIAAVSATTGSLLGFNPAANAQVTGLQISGTTLFAGGSFSNIGGQTRAGLAAIDTTTGNATSWNPSCTGCTAPIAFKLIGSTLYVGGSMASVTVGGASRKHAFGLDTTTAVATSWDPQPSSIIQSFATDGTYLYIAGSFTSISGSSRNRIAKYALGPMTLQSWYPTGGANNSINAIAVLGSTLYATGSFSAFAGQTRKNLVAVDTFSGSVLSTWKPEIMQPISMKSLVSDGTDLYLGGIYTNAGAITRNYAAAIDILSGEPTSWDPNMNAMVTAVKTAGGKIFLAGNFSSVNGGTARSYLAAYDLATEALDSMSPTFDSFILGLESDGSRIFANGTFSTVNGTFRNSICALNIATGALDSWNPLPNNIVNAAKIFNNKMYIGGAFTAVGGNSAYQYLSAIDLTTGTPTAWTPTLNGAVDDISFMGTTAYVVGGFTYLNGSPRNYAGAVDTVTASNLSWSPNMGAGTTVTTALGSNMYLGGFVSTANGSSIVSAVAVSATGSANTNIGTWNPNLGGGSTVMKMLPFGNYMLILGNYYSINALDFYRHIAPVSVSTGLLPY